MRLVAPISSLALGVEVSPPQLKPPTGPGAWTLPCKLTGVKGPSLRSDSMRGPPWRGGFGRAPGVVRRHPPQAEGRQLRREGLCRRGLLASDVRLRDRPLLIGEERLARLAVENEHVSRFRADGDGVDVPPVGLEREQNRLHRHVEVEHVVVDSLEPPDQLARRAGQADD